MTAGDTAIWYRPVLGDETHRTFDALIPPRGVLSKMPRRRYLGLLIFCGLAVIITALAIMSVAVGNRQATANRWHVHTLEVLLLTEQLRLAAEKSSGPAASAIVAELRRETRDNPGQQANVAALESRLLKPDAARLATSRADPSIATAIEHIAAEERRLLTLRTRAAATEGARIKFLAQIIAAVAVVLMAVAIFVAALLARRAMSLDLREQERLREALSSTGALLKTIVEAAPGLIFAKDAAGRMILANAPTLAVIGKSWSEVEGRTDAEFLDNPQEGLAIMRNDRRIMDAGRAETVEEQVSLPDGAAAIWLSTKAPLTGTQGHVTGLVGLSVDITARRDAEGRLHVLEEELWRAGRLGAMGELSLALAHEVNQPLAAIMNHLAIADHALAGELPIDRAALVHRLANASEQVMRAGAIIKRLNLFVQEGEPDRRPEAVRDLVSEAVRLASFRARRHDVQLTIGDVDSDAVVLADRLQVLQALLILVHNAIEVLEAEPKPGAAVSMLARHGHGNRVLLTVADNGPRLDPMLQAVLSERCSTATHWAGLGLANCRRIVEAHDGTLVYAPNAEGGSCFTISLPAADLCQNRLH